MNLEKPLILDAAGIDNAVLKRLISEVQYEQKAGINSYNRVHNRHNRSSGRPPVTPPTPTEQ